jgi:glucuronate isomerase
MRYFHDNGCRLADHGLETLYSEPYSTEQLNGSMQRAFQGLPNSPEDTAAFKSAVLHELSKMYHGLGWTQLYHLGALRNTNTRLRNTLGADCGTDSIGDFPQAINMMRFFDRLDRDNKLAPTVIFNLNPADNEVFASMIGNYNDGSMPGKMQYGSGWWFLDQKDGMQKQINALSNLGLLSRFVGMVTDSRSFLSSPRHEYFRRILCDLIGRDVENGELPYEMDLLGPMVQDICYNNAKNFFAFDSHS